MRLARPILLATLIAGTLDIIAAGVMTMVNGATIDAMLRAVASGPFPGATTWGAGGAAVGLLVHFVLMAVMAAVYIAAAARLPALQRQPLLWGTLYGIATYVVMNLLVVPIRFIGAPALPSSVATFAPQFAFHILLVGIPIALVAARFLRRR